MPHCPRSKTDPLATHQDMWGWWHVMCPVCCLQSNRPTRDYDQALFWFWQKHDKEKIMATYEEGYKRGVEDAGQMIREELPLSGMTDPVDVLNAIPHFLRKKLLTKKVTKWIAVFQGDELGLHPEGRFFDTKDTPNQFYCLCANYRGAYPLEIEVPL